MEWKYLHEATAAVQNVLTQAKLMVMWCDTFLHLSQRFHIPTSH